MIINHSHVKKLKPLIFLMCTLTHQACAMLVTLHHSHRQKFWCGLHMH